MPYTALYRKWRPASFDDVRGQDAIVKTLKNQIITKRIGHAYLFCGTRGTGKTSIAKIFARAVNCEAPHDGNPCNECRSCKSILDGNSINVFEIDAASNNGVDNIRDIKEQVEYPPTEGDYKVYIIDEVHMLSQGAFNALLKTLEEPPHYVIFILATTDPQKIPQTILSRCQRYDFKRISTDTIFKHLQEMKEKEGLSVEDRALHYIASSGDGSMRDALSLFDQCLAFHLGKELKYEDVLDILGGVDLSVYSELLNAIEEKDAGAALSVLNGTLACGKEIPQIITDFIWYLRNVLIAKSVSDISAIADVSEEEEVKIRADAEKTEKTELLKMITRFSELLNRARYSSGKRVLLEAEIISLIYGGDEENSRNRRNAEESSSVRLYEEAFSDKTQLSPKERQAPQSDLNLKRAEIDSPSLTQGKQSDFKREKVYSPGVEELSDEDIPTQKNRLIYREEPGRSSDLLSLIRENWPLLVRELSGSNKVVFQGTGLEEPEPGVFTVVFTNNMNYKLAATNKSENGLKKLAETVREKLGAEVKFTARPASAMQVRELSGKNKITEEDLAKIHFNIDRQEE